MSTQEHHRDTSELIAAGARIVILQRILAERERELLRVKGPCSNKRCTLHYAHSGPCDETEPTL